MLDPTRYSWQLQQDMAAVLPQMLFNLLGSMLVYKKYAWIHQNPTCMYQCPSSITNQP
jgi:hypothetical protein